MFSKLKSIFKRKDIPYIEEQDTEDSYVIDISKLGLEIPDIIIKDVYLDKAYKTLQEGLAGKHSIIWLRNWLDLGRLIIKVHTRKAIVCFEVVAMATEKGRVLYSDSLVVSVEPSENEDSDSSPLGIKVNIADRVLVSQALSELLTAIERIEDVNNLNSRNELLQSLLW